MNRKMTRKRQVNRVTTIPTGLQHSAQGWPRQRTTLSQPSQIISNPNGVVSISRHDGIQPFPGWNRLNVKPRVARSSQPWAKRYNPFGIVLRFVALPVLIAFVIFLSLAARAENMSIVIATNAAPRVEFGAEKLVEALKAVGMDSAIVCSDKTPGRKIYLNQPHDSGAGREGFIISRRRGDESQTKRNLETPHVVSYID